MKENYLQDMFIDEVKGALKSRGAAGSGGGADWNASEGEAGYVKNRTHYEETTVVNEPLNITWDGDTEGLVSVDADGDIYWKLSDTVLSDAQIKSATFMISVTSEPIVAADDWDWWVSEGRVTEGVVWNDYILFVRKPNSVIWGVTFPEVGIYSCLFESTAGECYVSSLTTTEPVPQSKTVVHKLDKKFLPDDVGGGGASVQSVQSDLAQNDPTAPDYVKNRTHWSERGVVELLKEQSLEFEADIGASIAYGHLCEAEVEINAGDKLFVTLEGKKYESIVKKFNGDDEWDECLYAGNLALMTQNASYNTGEDFLVLLYTDTITSVDGYVRLLQPATDWAAYVSIGLSAEATLYHSNLAPYIYPLNPGRVREAAFSGISLYPGESTRGTLESIVGRFASVTAKTGDNWNDIITFYTFGLGGAAYNSDGTVSRSVNVVCCSSDPLLSSVVFTFDGKADDAVLLSVECRYKNEFTISSQNGKKFKITVDDNGTLTATQV